MSLSTQAKWWARLIRIELPYFADNTELFARIAHLPWAVWLDSCAHHPTGGRFDIISAFPDVTLITHDHLTTIQHGDKIETRSDDPFTILKSCIPQYKTTLGYDLPFSGGAIGYFGYDLARTLEKLPTQAKDDLHLPVLHMGIYAHAIVSDHQLQQTWLISQSTDNAPNFQALQDAIKKPAMDFVPFQLTNSFQPTLTPTEYIEKLKQIHEHIRLGNCYQINFTERFQANFSGDPWLAYRHLRQQNPAPFAGFMRCEDFAVLSLSPERFLQIQDRDVVTSPIKGTRPRAVDPVEDHALAQALLHSEKDRAENLMIVDLLRNDLSKYAEVDSVNVGALCDLAELPAVHHLVSTITARIASGASALDVVRGCFPGGSITGVPKVRAMGIIDELETFRRGIYCGSIGYIDGHDRVDTNIAIRTLVAKQDRIYCYAGGGIVADSNPEEEYQECRDKIKLIINALQHGVG